MPGFLITNNSDDGHSAEDSANAAAEEIFNYDETKWQRLSPKRVAAKKLQTKLVELLEPVFARVMEAEKANLVADTAGQLAKGLTHAELDGELDWLVPQVQALAKGTPWEQEFYTPVMTPLIKLVLGNHLATSQHIHRQIHSTKNDHLPEAQQFLALLRGEV